MPNEGDGFFLCGKRGSRAAARFFYCERLWRPFKHLYPTPSSLAFILRNLAIGLELQPELYSGELSTLKNALLPILAAAGGIAVPALIHSSMNAGTLTQAGIGIPMATGAAFAPGVLALLGNHVPASLKV